MSNPAVTKLVRDDIGNLRFWMDDNIGEDIHIHLDDLRLDMTTQEIYLLAEELKDSMNQLIQVDGFDCNKIDPVFLSLMLADKIKDLKRVKLDEVYLEDLTVSHKVLGIRKVRKLPKGRAVKALRGNTKENDGARKSHHVGQTSAERLSVMQNSIAQNGYPHNGQYIIIYGDDTLIRDGQHRASCLYVANGNIKIPILRLYFEKEKSRETSKVKKILKTLKKMKRPIVKLLKIVYHKGNQCKNRFFILTHKRSQKKMEQVFFE